ncbi:MAG TPA: hypothetical protein VHJ19_12365 [Gammaproteobacteria bacterium]|nr:hypothetical protein [Gammaproteobacteria bacterium]
MLAQNGVRAFKRLADLAAWVGDGLYAVGYLHDQFIADRRI